MGSTHASRQAGGKVEMQIGAFVLYSDTPYVWHYTIENSEPRQAQLDMALLLEHLVVAARVEDTRDSNATVENPGGNVGVVAKKGSLPHTPSLQSSLDLGVLESRRELTTNPPVVPPSSAIRQTARVVTPPPQVQRLREHTERQRQQQAELRKGVELVFAYWSEVMGHRQTLLDSKREKRIEARLRENGGNVGELLFAIDGAAKDDWIMGRDPRSSKRYDGIETVLRDRAQVERFAQAIPRYRRGETHPLLETKGES